MPLVAKFAEKERPAGTLASAEATHVEREKGVRATVSENGQFYIAVAIADSQLPEHRCPRC